MSGFAQGPGVAGRGTRKGSARGSCRGGVFPVVFMSEGLCVYGLGMFGHCHGWSCVVIDSLTKMFHARRHTHVYE